MRRQSLIQLNDELLALLDERAARTGRSRSALIREAVERYVADDLNARTDAEIVEAYRRVPQERDLWADARARDAIAAEPW